VTATPQEIYRRYVVAGAMTRDADALAEVFASDGVMEAPLVPPGHDYPRRLEGRDQIRAGMAAYYQRSANTDHTVDTGKSRYVLHMTSDPDLFVAEIDAVLNGPADATVVSLVQIFRIRDGKITLLRDYFAPEQVT
jgi:ketosteroid isomerase-like protein